MTTKDDQRGKHAPPTTAERITQALRARLRAADRIRTEFADAAYTRIGQRALVMFVAALFVLIVNLGVLGSQLFL